jgi:hypothetical protein
VFLVTANSRKSPKRNAERASGLPPFKVETAERFQTNPLWYRLVTRAQAKLTISAPDDPCEHEADQVADQVMRIPEPVVQHACPACVADGSPCPKCREEKRAAIPRKADDTGDMAGASVSERFLCSLGPGQPLDAATLGFMESRFGQDFSQVRLHTNARAAESAGAVNALAYTVGRDVVFRAGRYTPGSIEGRKLLAHELVHVLQQRSASDSEGAEPSISSTDERSKREAKRSSLTLEGVARHSAVSPTRLPMGVARLQRQIYGPPVATGAGADFDQYLLQFSALEQAAISEGYSFNDRITVFRKLYYDSASTVKTYAGAVVGGGAFNILIPAAAGTKLPASWSTPGLDGAADYLRKHQTLSIGGQSVDIGHMLAGADAAKHPASISLGGGTIKLRSNVEATTFIGDLGSVVTEYIHGSTASFHDVAMKRSTLLESYYDGASGMASAEDMAGNADAYSLSFNSSKTLAENLRDYYAATIGGVKKRFTTFASLIGLGILKGTTFTGDTKAWRNAMKEEVFNSALAYAAGKGWKSDVINVLNDPGPGLFAPTFWEMYWNNSEWVVDIFVNRMTRDVAKE